MTQLPHSNLSRRRFAATGAGLAAVAALAGRVNAQIDKSDRTQPKISLPAPPNLPYTIYKTLKFNMIQGEGSIAEKFEIALAAGYEGVEFNSPTFDVDQVNAAIDETGCPVDGTVCSTHWNVRHTSPEASVRNQALEDLQTAITQTHAVGGNTCLLVVGHGKDGEESAIWDRSVENIAKAIPLAAELGVVIAIENVWNHFLYDHDQEPEQTAEKFAKYVDEFNSPWVGMQFDIGNHWKYGDPGKWIRTLGKRIVKLDIKGFSRKDDKFTDIGEGDLPWKSVREALADIRFQGWCAAEVGGGDPDRLLKISLAMSRALTSPLGPQPKVKLFESGR
jgi:hexulose-6-phosphate isomerase